MQGLAEAGLRWDFERYALISALAGKNLAGNSTPCPRLTQSSSPKLRNSQLTKFVISDGSRQGATKAEQNSAILSPFLR